MNTAPQDAPAGYDIFMSFPSFVSQWVFPPELLTPMSKPGDNVDPARTCLVWAPARSVKVKIRRRASPGRNTRCAIAVGLMRRLPRSLLKKSPIASRSANKDEKLTAVDDSFIFVPSSISYG